MIKAPLWIFLLFWASVIVEIVQLVRGLVPLVVTFTMDPAQFPFFFFTFQTGDQTSFLFFLILFGCVLAWLALLTAKPPEPKKEKIASEDSSGIANEYQLSEIS